MSMDDRKRFEDLLDVKVDYIAMFNERGKDDRVLDIRRRVDSGELTEDEALRLLERIVTPTIYREDKA